MISKGNKYYVDKSIAENSENTDKVNSSDRRRRKREIESVAQQNG